MSQGGRCLAVVPQEAIALYRFFEPALPSCGDVPETHDAVALVLTPYSSRESGVRLATRLLASGFSEDSAHEVGGTRIRIFRNDARISFQP